MPHKTRKDDLDLVTSTEPGELLVPDEPPKPDRPIPKPKPEPEELKVLTPAEQARALTEAKDRPAELARQKQQYNPKREQPKPDGDLKLSSRQFVRARKLQWRHAVGFMSSMTRTLGPAARLTVKEWTVHWDEFWTRPVKGPR
jgi:hypothetical protein